MNTKQDHPIPSGATLTLPEPDPDNITVLTRNLPNKPILPWNHYDSPWRDPEAEDTDKEAENLDQSESADETEEGHTNKTTNAADQQSQTSTDELHQLDSSNPSG